MRLGGEKIFRVGLLGGMVVFMMALASCPGGDGEEDETARTPWPKWVFEHWVWYDESTQEEAVSLVEEYLAHEIPVGAVIIDSPWETGYNTFEWDPNLYPDPRVMVKWFHDRGVKVVVWTTPVINGVCPGDTSRCPEKELFDQAMANHFLMGDGTMIPWWKCPEGVTYCGGLIDYFNPAALRFWHDLLDPVLELGIDGWKCDSIEPYSLLASVSPYYGPTEPWEFNDRYYEDFFHYTRQKLGGDRVIMARPIEALDLSELAGTTLVIAVPNAPREVNFAGWVGDQDPTFPGLQAALLNMYLSAQVGYLVVGSDIGGYRGTTRTQELFLRWVELGALSPLMENGGGGEHRPWMIGGNTAEREDTLKVYRDYVDLHYALIPYLHHSAKKAWADKKSLLTLIEQGNKMYQWEYLLGPDLLVAPMFEAGISRTVKFPEGNNWVYLFNRSQVYTGGTEEDLNFPLEEFPVFLRQGSNLERTLRFP